MFVLALAAGFSPPTSAYESTSGAMRIQHPWARASIGLARNGVAYVTLVNTSKRPDRLVAVSTPMAARATMHTHMMRDNVMKMRPVGVVEIPPGETTVFKPGGLHIMLTGMAGPLREGTRFPLILEFEIAGKIEILVNVKGATAMGVIDDALHHKPHKHGGS